MRGEGENKMDWRRLFFLVEPALEEHTIQNSFLSVAVWKRKQRKALLWLLLLLLLHVCTVLHRHRTWRQWELGWRGRGAGVFGKKEIQYQLNSSSTTNLQLK